MDDEGYAWFYEQHNKPVPTAEERTAFLKQIGSDFLEDGGLMQEIMEGAEDDEDEDADEDTADATEAASSSSPSK